MKRIEALGTAAGRSVRAGFRYAIAALVGLAFHRVVTGLPVDPATVRSILVCRPNAKLGNTLLLTPLLVESHRQYPDAAINLVSSYPRAARLLRGLPGFRRVMSLSHRPAANPVAYVRQIAAIRRGSYDLAIDPIPRSTSGRMILWFSRSWYRLGFTRQGRGPGLTHGCPAPATTFHESLRPLLLLRSIVTDESDIQAPPLCIVLNDAERVEGNRQVHVALAGSDLRGRRLIGYFTDAAGRKAMGGPWWQAFWDCFQALEPKALPIEFLSWKQADRTDARHAGLAIGCPKQMAAAMASLDLFVTADTGPMHVASATPVPTIGLFTETDPECYGPRKLNDLALHVSRASPEEAARMCVEHLRCHPHR